MQRKGGRIFASRGREFSPRGQENPGNAARPQNTCTRSILKERGFSAFVSLMRLLSGNIAKCHCLFKLLLLCLYLLLMYTYSYLNRPLSPLFLLSSSSSRAACVQPQMSPILLLLRLWHDLLHPPNRQGPRERYVFVYCPHKHNNKNVKQRRRGEEPSKHISLVKQKPPCCSL